MRRKKLILSICTLCLVTVLSVVAIVAVLAAGSQTLQSNISVEYVATNVAATLNANYIIGETKTPMKSQTGASSISVLPTDTSIPGLSPLDENNQARTLTLDVDHQFIIFEFVFRNDSEDVPIYLESQPAFTEQDNMTIEYLWSNEELTSFSSFSEEMTIQEILGSSTLYVYVRAKISNAANDASLEGSFIWILDATEPSDN